MSSNTEAYSKPLDQMSTEHISMRIQQKQREINIFLEHILTRAQVQEYTEQQYGELLVLLQEASEFIEEVPVDEKCILEWTEKRRSLMKKIQKKL